MGAGELVVAEEGFDPAAEEGDVLVAAVVEGLVAVGGLGGSVDVEVEIGEAATGAVVAGGGLGDGEAEALDRGVDFATGVVKVAGEEKDGAGDFGIVADFVVFVEGEGVVALAGGVVGLGEGIDDVQVVRVCPASRADWRREMAWSGCLKRT